MKKNMVIPIIIVVVGGGLGIWMLLGGQTGTGVIVPPAVAQARKVDLEIQGMFCLGCRSSVVSSLMSLPGVLQADADPQTDSGWAIYDSEQISKEQIVAAPIFDAYPAKVVADKKYEGATRKEAQGKIPDGVSQKLSTLARLLQEREIVMESFFQQELDDAINQGYWNKANNLLDNYIETYSNL